MSRRTLRFFLGLGVVALALPPAGHARDAAAEREIEGDLARIDGALVPGFHAATVAFDAGKYQEAARGYEATLTKVPRFTPALRRLGGCRIELGDRAAGLKLEEDAVTIERSAENLESYAFGMLRAEGDQASTETRRGVADLLEESRTKPRGGDPDVLYVLGQIDLGLNRRRDADEVVATLLAKYPPAPQGHYLKGVEAAVDGRWLACDREMRRARKLGFTSQADAFLGIPAVSEPIRNTKIGLVAGALIGGWLLGLLALYLSGAALSRATLAAIRPAEPGQATLRPAEHRLRRIYRAIINVAGIYYYLSLPIILVLVVGIAAGIIWLTLSGGFIAIKLFFIVVIGAVMTIFALIKSLLLRTTGPEPGRPLAREEAPGLWALAEDAARLVGTRPVDEIRLTTGTDVAVYERGSWRAKLRDDAKRILLLGTAVLPGFRQDDFLCVLAHEYGHFSHRDTAGGEIALRVRADMLRFARQMQAARQNTRYNVAFHFLRVYDKIFRRISHGATRLQEVLADRVAAQAYGAGALEGGLRHVIRRGFEFDRVANDEIKRSLEAKVALSNVYQMTAPAGTDLEAKIQKAMERPTTLDDSHPGPSDRFRLVAGLPRTTGPARAGDVWELIVNRDAIMKEMMENLEKIVAPHRR